MEWLNEEPSSSEGTSLHTEDYDSVDLQRAYSSEESFGFRGFGKADISSKDSISTSSKSSSDSTYVPPYFEDDGVDFNATDFQIVNMTAVYPDVRRDGKRKVLKESFSHTFKPKFPDRYPEREFLIPLTRSGLRYAEYAHYVEYELIESLDRKSVV